MFRNSLRCVLMLATLSVAYSGVAQAQTIAPPDVHREAVDVSQYPWSSIGKLYNETGGGCTAVIIAPRQGSHRRALRLQFPLAAIHPGAVSAFSRRLSQRAIHRARARRLI